MLRLENDDSGPQSSPFRRSVEKVRNEWARGEEPSYLSPTRPGSLSMDHADLPEVHPKRLLEVFG